MATYTDELITKLSMVGAEAMAREMQKVGGGMGKAGKEAGGLGKQMGLMNLQQGLAGLQSVGQGALNMADDLIAASKNSQYVQKQLEAIFRQQGIAPEAIKSVLDMSHALQEKTGYDDESIMSAARLAASFGMLPKQIEQAMPMMIRQAETMGVSLEGVSSAFGKAFSSGNYGALRRAGVALGQVEIDTMKAAKEMTDFADPIQKAAFDAKFLDVVLGAINRTSVPLGSSLDTAAGKARLMAAHIDDLKENMGAGAMEARGNYKRAIDEVILSLTKMDPELQKNAGNILWYGGEAVTGAGKALQFSASIGQTVMGLQAMGATVPSLSKLGPALIAAGAPVAAFAASAAFILWVAQNIKDIAEEGKDAEANAVASATTEAELRAKGSLGGKTGERKGAPGSGWKQFVDTYKDYITLQSYRSGFEGMEQTGTTITQEQATGKKATARRGVNGDIHFTATIKGGAGVSQNDLQTVNTLN